jgi:hypothetical protein
MFGNLVRQTIPNVEDSEIQRILHWMHAAGQLSLSKFVRSGPFYGRVGLRVQGGEFFDYVEWRKSETFFQGEFIVGLVVAGK